MTERITVNTQSSIRIEAERIVYADPLKLESAPGDADLILVTHAHFDHFSPEDIKKAAKPGTVLVLPESMRADAKKAGITDIVTLSPGETREIRGVTVEAVAAYNIGKPMHPKKNGWLGYIVTLGGTRIYIAGDTDVTPETEAVRCDIAMVPVGGIYTMNAKESRCAGEQHPSRLCDPHALRLARGHEEGRQGLRRPAGCRHHGGMQAAIT